MRKTLYGYHPDPMPFVKIYLRNPADMNKVVAILEVGYREMPLMFYSHNTMILPQPTAALQIQPMIPIEL
jgi:hypothetical protein